MKYSPMTPFMVTAALMTAILVFSMILFLITLKNRQNEKDKEAQKALLQERERTMYIISMEIHDSFNNMLYLAAISMNTLEDMENDPEKLKIISKVQQLIDTLTKDGRNISHTLNTDYLREIGLVKSLKQEVEWVNTSKKIQCELQIVGSLQKLSEETELRLFRIAQEAISNSIKYSKASKIDITLTYNYKSFEMAIVDNGKGFDLKSDQTKNGVGLLSMRQRAEVLDGELNIITAPDAGTAIVLTMNKAFARSPPLT